jgi:hypothetical protein
VRTGRSAPFVFNKGGGGKGKGGAGKVMGRGYICREEKNAFAACFKEVKVVKRQFIVQPGFTSRSRYFVVKGALRAYVVGDEGQDRTIQFAIDEWWISDYNIGLWKNIR